MANQVVPVTGLDAAGLVADSPAVAIPPEAFSDCRNVRFREGSAQKMRGDVDIFPNVIYGDTDVLKYVVWWPNPNLAVDNQGYYLLIVTRGNNDLAYMIKADQAPNPTDIRATNIPEYKGTFRPGGNWQHTFFQGGFALIINNGLEAPRYVLDDEDNTEVGNVGQDLDGTGAGTQLGFTDLPGWASYAVNSVNVGTVTAGVIRTYGDLLIAGNLVERNATGGIIRALPNTIRTSDIAAPGAIPQNWNPFNTAVNTADEFVVTGDGVVQDFVELQGNMYVYSNSSISVVSRTGNPNTPISVRPVTSAYGALTTDSVIEFDGRHFVVGSRDIFLFGGHPGSIQSIAEGRVRDYFYDAVNNNSLENIFVLRYQPYDEIWLCFPSQTAADGRANEALIWNYRKNTWTKRDLNGAYAGVVGPAPGGGIPRAGFVMQGNGNDNELIPGLTHQVTVSEPSVFARTTDGRQHVEDFTVGVTGITVDPLFSTNTPAYAVTFGEDFFTGTGTNNRAPVRCVIRYRIGTGEQRYIIHLPTNLGQNADYASAAYKTAVLDPIIAEINTVLDDDPNVSISTFGGDLYGNNTFVITFASNTLKVDGQIHFFAPGPIRSLDDVDSTDRPRTDDDNVDTSLDAEGLLLPRATGPTGTDAWPATTTVFSFDIASVTSDIHNLRYNNLDDYVFFLTGLPTGMTDPEFVALDGSITAYRGTGFASTGNESFVHSAPVSGITEANAAVITIATPYALSNVVEVGDTITVRGAEPTGYNQDYTITAISADRRTITTSTDTLVTPALGTYTGVNGYVGSIPADDDTGGRLTNYVFSRATGTTIDLTAPLFPEDIRALALQTATQSDTTEFAIMFDSTTLTDVNLVAYRIRRASDGVADYDLNAPCVVNPAATCGPTVKITINEAVYNKSILGYEAGTQLPPVVASLTTVRTSASNVTTDYISSILYALEEVGPFVSRLSTGTETFSIRSTSRANRRYLFDIDYNRHNVDVTATVTSTSSTLGQVPVGGTDGDVYIPPCIRVRHTDPNGITFFDFETPLIELSGTTSAEIQNQLSFGIIAAAPQWNYTSATRLFESRAVTYNQANGDTGVPYPMADGTYMFNENRTHANFSADFYAGNIDANGTLAPSFTLTRAGFYDQFDGEGWGSYFAMNLSNNVTYLFYLGDNDRSATDQLREQIATRIPGLELTVEGGFTVIAPTIIGENTIFVREAFLNIESTITDFRRLLTAPFIQDANNPQLPQQLPEAVLSQQTDMPFPFTLGNEPNINNVTITTDFDFDRTWPEGAINFAVEYPLFAAGKSFPNGTSVNAVIASEVGYAFPNFIPGQVTYVPYESFIRRDQMAMAPEFTTESVAGVAIWADGSTPTSIAGSRRYNVLQMDLSTTNNPGQEVDLNNAQYNNTFYISEDYKMDIRLTGRFLNWKLSDMVDGTLEAPGGKTFSQRTDWRVSGLQWEIRAAGRR